MVLLTLASTSSLSTSLGTSFLSFAGLKMVRNSKKDKKDNTCPVLDGCVTTNLSLGFTCLLIGGVLAISALALK